MNNITYLIAGALGGICSSLLLNWWLARRKKRSDAKIPLFVSTHGLESKPAIDDTMTDARYWLGRFHGLMRAHVRRKPEPHDPPTLDNQNPGIEFWDQDALLRNLWVEIQSHGREITHARKQR